MGATLFSKKNLVALSRCIGYHTDPRFTGLVLHTRMHQQSIQSCWCFRIQIHGRRFYRLIGIYPQVDLHEAWERAQLCCGLLRDCFDVHTSLGQAINIDPNLTFRDYWVRWIASEREANPLLSTKYFQDIAARGINHLFPYFGELPMQEITSHDIAYALNQAYKSHAASSVKKIRQNIINFYRWMNAFHYLDESTCHAVEPSTLDILVTKPASQRMAHPHPSISQSDLPRFVRLITSPDMLRVPGILPLLFILFTASRIGNVIGSLNKDSSRPMKWSDLDEHYLLWTIPAENMKAGRTNGNHLIPLSLQAQKVLRIQKDIQQSRNCRSQYVFDDTAGIPFNYRKMHALISMIRKLDRQAGNNGFVDEDTKAPFHIHGLRSTFKTWGTDYGIDWTLTELALHHRIDKLKYDRSKAIKRRRTVMQQWANYCCSEIANKWLDDLDAKKPENEYGDNRWRGESNPF